MPSLIKASPASLGQNSQIERPPGKTVTFGSATVPGVAGRFSVMLMHRRGLPIWLSEHGIEYRPDQLRGFAKQAI